jgi:putative phage-type endonuclease
MKSNVLVNTLNITKDEWLVWRNRGIGGSDVGAIVGLNKWKSALDIYLDKTGRGKEYQENESAYWGNTLEEVVAREFEKRTGKKLKRRNAILQHPEYTFMLANVDRLLIGEKAGFEAKTVSAYGAEEWEGEEIPESYVLQCMHYMIVTGLKKWYIACLIGGQKFVYKEIECAIINLVPVIELPCLTERKMSIEDTRQFLKEMGIR